MLQVSQDLWGRLDHQERQEREEREASLDLRAWLVPQDKLVNLDLQDFKEDLGRKDPRDQQELRDIVALLVSRVFLDQLVLSDRKDLQEKMERMENLEPWAVEDLLDWTVLWVREAIRDQWDPEESLARKANVVLLANWVLLVLQVLQGKETTWIWLP